ncbi:hypothetical protein LUZ63_006540 [Rhynchospora breviuscula]|uniref:Nuclear pore complex protein NUP88 n=1 Tax=Rhynchospora breviuscula TaxID=2022672 RepID=A0A9Q0CQD3_9POAL|nr:hypothetical protein LUZ63_006540 [Rhynchospora breviuscula]
MTRITAPPSPPPSPPLSPPLPSPTTSTSTSTSTSLVPSSSLPLSNAKRSKRSFLEWVPLASHPVFASLRDSHPSLDFNPGSGGRLAAWDAVMSRLYLWDPTIRGIHSLPVRLQDSEDGSEPWDQVSVEAAVPSETLVPSVQITHEVHQISVNKDGSALLIAGSDKLTVISIFDKTSTNGETVICRAVPVATQILLGQDKGMRVLQASWHPFSRTHFGFLTSDAVFRLFDLSSNLERPEQEFYLQQVPSGRGLSAVLLCPVAFSYGGHYLWETFSIFFLFSDGSIYILCPVVPFGSLYTQKRIKEIYDEVRSFESEASNTNAIRTSRLALSWLEETFPEMLSEVLDVHGLSLCRACAYAPLDASLILQGPLCKISHDQGTDVLKGRAVSFLYTSAGKDSILVTAFNTSLLYIQALADEIHPQWATDAGPRLSLDANHNIKGVAMICESSPQNTNGPGQTPPLIELAVVDLELSDPDQKQQGAVLSIFPDPVVGERFYCVHSGGADAVTLNFLPFSNVDVELASAKPPPSVQPVLKIDNKGLYGFAAIADSFGGSHIIGVTHKYECIVIEMKRWKETVTLNWGEIGEAGSVDMTSGVMTSVSKDLLAGPKPVVLNSSGSLKMMNPESIEGRSTLHHYMKIFRENYVEYAHKVSIELKQRTGYLKSLIEEQNKRVNAVKKLLETVETKEDQIQERIECACSSHADLEKRLNKLRSLPLVHKKPLSKAERDFRGQLDRFVGVELDALHSAIEALSARMKRYNSSHASSVSPRRTALKGRTHASESQVSLLKSSLGKLSSINEENTQKLKLLEQHFASLEM